MRRPGSALAVGALAFALACAPSGKDEQSLALQAVAGTYNDGSGRLGPALLATLRDPSGQGPQQAWSGTFTASTGGASRRLDYVAPGRGSYAALWWPEDLAAAGDYVLALAAPDGASLERRVSAHPDDGLALPAPTLNADGTGIVWPDVPGAAAYECRVRDGATPVLGVVSRAPACDVGALPPGAYSVDVLAYSVDVAALAEDAAQRPVMPERFDVSEARFAFARGAGAETPVLLQATGGAFHDGTSRQDRTLAVWVSIHDPAGAPTAEPWTLEIVGPGISPAFPLTFTYPAHFPRMLVWSYEQPVSPGGYAMTARSERGDRLAVSFSVGQPAPLSPPQGVVASAASGGVANVTWSGVPGAQSYLVSVWDRASFSFVTSQWVADTRAAFPPGTFAAGRTYDVYVAAADAAMTRDAVPAQVSVTENTYQPAAFIGR